VKTPVPETSDDEEETTDTATVEEDDEDAYEAPPVYKYRKVYYVHSPRKYVTYNSYRRNHGYNVGYGHRTVRYGGNCHQNTYGY
jgi:hypothetical protein